MLHDTDNSARCFNLRIASLQSELIAVLVTPSQDQSCLVDYSVNVFQLFRKESYCRQIVVPRESSLQSGIGYNNLIAFFLTEANPMLKDSHNIMAHAIDLEFRSDRVLPMEKIIGNPVSKQYNTSSKLNILNCK